MRVCIVGAGNVGRSIARELITIVVTSKFNDGGDLGVDPVEVLLAGEAGIDSHDQNVVDDV